MAEAAPVAEAALVREGAVVVGETVLVGAIEGVREAAVVGEAS